MISRQVTTIRVRQKEIHINWAPPKSRSLYQALYYSLHVAFTLILCYYCFCSADGETKAWAKNSLRSDRLEVVLLEFVSRCGSSPASFSLFSAPLRKVKWMTLTAYGRAHGKYNRTDRLWSRSAKGLGTKEDTGLKKIYRWRYASPTCPVSFSDMMTSSTGCCYHGYRRWSSFFQGEQTMGRCAHEFSFTSCKMRIGTDFIVFL